MNCLNELFKGCVRLIHIDLPQTITSIGSYAFASSGLLSIRFPAAVTYIADRAFNTWDGQCHITSISFLSNIPPTLERDVSRIFNLYYLDTIIIPCGSFSAYQETFSDNFTYIEEGCSVFVTVTSNDTNKDNVDGGGLYSHTAIISATPNYGYRFVQWSDGDTTNPRMIQVSQDTSFIAIFDYDNFRVRLYVEDTMMGFIMGDGIFNYLSTATITGVANPGFRFYRWTDGNTCNPRYVTVISDSSFTAFFIPEIIDSIYVHDTIVVNDTLVRTEIVFAHDTSYINVYDTTTVIDTVMLIEYVPIHDTTIVSVHDTTFINVHDTTYISQMDTVTNVVTVYDTITNTVIDTITNNIYDTTFVISTDTLWLHDTVFIHDTIYIHDTVDVDDVNAINAKIYTSLGQIVVEGAEGNVVRLYDVNGRILTTKQDEYTSLHFDIPASGTYLIKIGNHSARKVVVIR